MVFYRKYRPQSIEELDSSAVREKLHAVLGDLTHIPHAFLFTGPKGLGKTSTARIIGKIVNCTGEKKLRGKSHIEPCNACESCISITSGTNLDVLEIDAASNRGIDEMRELKERINLAPLASKKKVYIIDEVHMLTTEAFNALLKTLEEPPAHAMFILCTTEPQKVPPTILSRTFHISLKKATTEELVRSFHRISKAEGLSITDDALLRIAELSDGGFRDGAKLLEEVVSMGVTAEITRDMIDERYHISGIDTIKMQLIEYLASRQTKESLALINQYVTDGNDIRYLTEQVTFTLHQALLQGAGVTIDEPLAIPLNPQELKTVLQLLIKALSEMKFSVMPQLPLELAVIDWGYMQQTEQLVPRVQKQSEAESSTTVVANVPENPTVVSMRKQVGAMQKEQALYGEKKEVSVKKVVTPPADVSVLNFSAEGEITPEWLQHFWSAIIQDIKKHNHTLAGVMRGCRIKSFDRKTLIIETAFAFHRDKLDNAKTKDILEQICRTLTGNPVTITVELRDAN